MLSRRWTRSAHLGVVGVLVAVAMLPASAAQAAAPANDAIERAVAVSAVPSRFFQSTAAATSGPDDGECVGGSSVWFRYRPTSSSTVRLNTVGSTYDTVVAVFRGPAGSRTPVACNDDLVVLWSGIELQARAGSTYWIAVSACCDTRATGGRLVLSLYPGVSPATPTVALTRAQTGSVSGRLFLEGTIACRLPFAGLVAVTVSQRVGPGVARGGGELVLPCRGVSPTRWSMTLDSQTDWAFRAGPAGATASSQVSDGFIFDSTPERTRTLRITSRPGAAPPAGTSGVPGSAKDVAGLLIRG